ncbi:uncharacterized protein [Rhodnius prolixus]|uniref:uncharacterized protein n=1 Tax=Rhodnius prolixus TaxID=13249 RepID=UPI003D18C011
MADYTSIIEQIKQSDAKICAMTKQMKEMETEIKKTENEIEIIRAKNRQLQQDIKYKKKILDDKKNELNKKHKEFEIWQEMKKEKEKQLEVAKKELEEVQKRVFNSRIEFNEKSNEFLNQCDYLVARSHDIDLAVEKRKEKNKLLNEISELEQDTSMLEQQYQELHKEIELLQELERTKQFLEKEPECGEEFKRIQLKIDSFEEKLEDFTYNEIQRPNQMNPNYENSLKSTQDSRTQSAFNDMVSIKLPASVYQNIYTNQDVILTAEGFVNCDYALPTKKKKVMRNFTPKIPSTLSRNNLSKRQNI